MGQYNAHINRKLDLSKDLKIMDINKLLEKITSNIQLAKKISQIAAKTNTKLRQSTKALLARRRKVDRDLELRTR